MVEPTITNTEQEEQEEEQAQEDLETSTESVEDFDEQEEEQEGENEQEELEEELVELSENEEDLFDGVDDVDETVETGIDEQEEVDMTDTKDSEVIGEAVVDGCSALCTVGLEQDVRSDYEEDFKNVFTKFKVDHFAERTWEEKIATGNTEIDPVWGLVGSICIASIMCYMQRPDSDEKIAKLQEKIANKGDS